MDYQAVGFRQLRWLPFQLRSLIGEMGLSEDLDHSIRLAALEAQQRGYSIQETSRHVNRALYWFLKSYGFRRTRTGSYILMEHPGTLPDDGQDMDSLAELRGILPDAIIEIGAKLVEGQTLSPTERTRLHRFRKGTFRRTGRAGRPSAT